MVGMSFVVFVSEDGKKTEHVYTWASPSVNHVVSTVLANVKDVLLQCAASRKRRRPCDQCLIEIFVFERNLSSWEVYKF